MARQAVEGSRTDEGDDGNRTWSQAPGRSDSPPAHLSVEDSMAEFRELAASAGAQVVGQVIQRRDKLDAATLIGRGKLAEITGAVASSAAVSDHLTPAEAGQPPHARRPLRRPERARDGNRPGAEHRARPRRHRGRGRAHRPHHGAQEAGGPGETQLETDRRKIYRRMRHVQQQLENVRRVRAQQRQRRESVPVETVALVGYTNAGKSTLFNALTKAGVLASSRMFATLDPTLRSVLLPSKRKVLLSDTVGFIRSLPHTLVTSFRATLEEVQRASLILHVSDATSRNAPEQQEQVEKVLGELDALQKTTLRVLNKIDLLGEKQRQNLPAGENIVHVSALSGEGLDALLSRIDAVLTADPVDRAEVSVPQREGKVLAMIEARGTILRREYNQDKVLLTIEAPRSLLRRLEQFQEKQRPSVTPGRNASSPKSRLLHSGKR